VVPLHARPEQRLSNMMHRAMEQLRKLKKDQPPDVQSDFTAKLIAAETEAMQTVQNEPISRAPRAADGANEGCEQASQEIVIMEPVKLGRTRSDTSRNDAKEGPISPGA